MDLILNEAIEEEDSFKLVSLDESDGEYCEEEQSFVEDEKFICYLSENEEQQGPSFYRSVDNKTESVKFANQIKKPEAVVDESEDEYFGEDDMPEPFDPEIRKKVEFDAFSSASNKSKLFKNSLLRFPNNLDNQFFYAVVYGIMYNKINGQQIFLEDAEKTLGTDLFFELKKIEKSTMLDHSIFFFFFNRCQSINNVLNYFGYFLRFYERRNKFRYQLRQKLKEKNQMKRELSACVIQKFNGYELIRNSLNSKERKDFVPIDIVYKPTLKEIKSIECFFAQNIYLGYTTAVERTKYGKKIIERCVARQCHYCNNFFYQKCRKNAKTFVSLFWKGWFYLFF